MTRREEFVDLVRAMVATPFHHQGRVPGVGIDCAGVVVCAAQAVGIEVADQQGYSRIPSGGQFLAAVKEHCEQIAADDVRPGDLMMFSWRTEPQHLAVVVAMDPMSIVHAHQQVGGVVEHEVDNAWWRRFRAFWRLRGLD
jgi:cell wall-associated NlpC family hydrolase